MIEDLDFEPKRILKHKNHVTINEGETFDTTVQHLKITDDGEFVELKDNEAAKKFGSKKLVRDIDFKSRDGLQQEQDSGLGKTPEWFPQVLPTVPWNDYRTLLYELDHLWLNMFFVRELYAEESQGREQILSLSNGENGLTLEVLTQIDYDCEEKSDYDKDEVDGFIKVEIDKEKHESGRDDYGVDADYRQTVFEEDEQHISSGLREILTGICLKHGYRGEQLHFKVEKLDGGEYKAKVLNKDFTLRFNEDLDLDTGVSPWVLELLYWDGCPLDVESIEVTELEG